MKSILILVICLLSTSINAQLSIYCDSKLSNPDINLQIDNKHSNPDIAINIGENFSNADYTISISRNLNNAESHLVKSRYSADILVKASNDKSYPDFRIALNNNNVKPDVSFRITNSASADINIYCKLKHPNYGQIVAALLPRINKHLNYKYELITRLANQLDTPKPVDKIDLTKLKGCAIYAQDENNTFLGEFSGHNEEHSIFNSIGNYGSDFSSQSIWYDFGTFGNGLSNYSIYYDQASHPPMIVRNNTIVGYLTTNENIEGGIHPDDILKIKNKFK